MRESKMQSRMFKKGMHGVQYEHAMGIRDLLRNKLKNGNDTTEGKSTSKYVKFNYKKVIWEYGKSIMRFCQTRPYEEQVAAWDATWMILRRVQEDDKV
jgi:hypothetical protein